MLVSRAALLITKYYMLENLVQKPKEAQTYH